VPATHLLQICRGCTGTSAIKYPSNTHINTLLTDLRVGFRLLWRDKVFTATAVLTLAVCIGANADSLPLGNSASASAIFAEGYHAKPGESVLAPAEVRVSHGYFETIGTRLVAGRFFSDRDAATAPRVIIVDDRLARRLWPNESPLGRRMYRPSDDGDTPTAITDKTEFMTVVGVVAEMKLRNLTDGHNRVGAYFIPLAQEPQHDLTFVLRTDGDPTALSGALRREIAAVDGQLPVFEMQPMSYWTDRSLAGRRSPALLSIAFGFVALFLSAIGIYGVLAYLVTQRTKEFGIRVALGSSALAVFKLVLREGMLLVGIGLLVGALGSFVLRRALEGQLFGVTASNPVVLVLVTAVLTVVALVACAVPARRATKIDPLIALNDA
jgi:putative ABC transport system permease protein